jgi:cytochrome c peroxidase
MAPLFAVARGFMTSSSPDAFRRPSVKALLLAVVAAVPGFAAAAEPIQPLPLDIKVDVKKAALGENLFNDKRLSRDNSVSCASCHQLDKGGADGRRYSTGVGGTVGRINAPTVFNATYNFRQFWDGRAASLTEQAGGPIQNPIEMGSNWPDVLGKLKADAKFTQAFNAVYPDGLRPENIQDAIAQYEQTLTTPNSRFDRYLRGDAKAITADELQGYQNFKKYGCVACHQGVNVGGNMFQVFGVMGDYFAKRGHETDSDLGRFNVTKNPSDKHVFKVPSLRNVALTAPYFHDGSAATLDDAVDVMFKYQLGRTVPEQDKKQIVLFLQTLTGEYRGGGR